jgi:hypothetical protein
MVEEDQTIQVKSKQTNSQQVEEQLVRRKCAWKRTAIQPKKGGHASLA